LFFDPDEIPDWSQVMDQVIGGKRKDGPAAVPSVKFLDLYSELI
jgi:hypothetical protein